MSGVTFEIDTRAFAEKRREFYKQHVDALRRSFAACVFRVLQEERARLRRGIEPSRADMTAAIAKRRGRTALTAFAAMPAYEIKGDGLSAKIGFSAAGSRRARPLPLKLIEQVLQGRNITVTPEVQQAIALKAQRRGIKGRKRFEMIMPHQGKRLRVPKRDVMGMIGAEQIPKVPGWLMRLYDVGMSGGRWANDWGKE